MKAGMTIGEAAKELRLNPKTIRYYEEIGLLPEPRRSESGYRLYSEGELDRLRLTRKAKLLGLSLADIKEIVEYAIDGRCSVLEERLLSLVETKLIEVDQKMADLITFKDDLRRYQKELTRRLGNSSRKEKKQQTVTGCQCIG